MSKAKPNSSRSTREELLQDPEIRGRYEASFALWKKRTQPYRDAIHRSERITEDDLSIVINRIDR
jgi:hypothetical protein